MITLETGVPGAGKTLYCVDKLLRPLVGATVKSEDKDGNIIDVPRIIYSNINGLLLDHQKIGPDELNTWHLWAKPGAIIVYDEIQKPWPLAATGSKVPECIQALETHRHMGVDFIVLTQHPMLIHANMVRLVGRHLHVRRMGNMGLAIVYEWDSCSKTLLYKNALAKSPYKYSKAVFELYKSAELHTKQPRKIPSLVWGVLVGLVALTFFFPTVYGRLAERINPKPVIAKVVEPKPIQGGRSPLNGPADPVPAMPVSAASGGLVVPAVPEVQVAGCAALRGVCRCYDLEAHPVVKTADFCQSMVLPAVPELLTKSVTASLDVLRSGPAAQTSLEMVEWVYRKN